jgi:hypothetical protein
VDHDFQGFLDASVGDLALAVDALGIDPQEHVHAVPGTLGDLGGVHAGVEPQRHRGVPQVVGTARQRGGGPLGGEREQERGRAVELLLIVANPVRVRFVEENMSL